MLAALLHAAASRARMSEVIRWLDARSFERPIEILEASAPVPQRFSSKASTAR